jgi:hypothetical protein
MKFKVIISALIGLVAVLFVGVGVFWVVTNFRALVSNSALYTITDIEQARQDGYIDGQGNNARLLNQVETLNEAINEYQTELANKQGYLDDAANALLQSELSNESKARLIDELRQNIFELTFYINELNAMILTLRNEKFELQQLVAVLQEQKENLLRAVYAYEQLVGVLDELNNRFVVTFMFDDVVYSILLVPNGERVQIESPTSTEYTIFLGWSFELDGDLVDINTWTPTADTILYAKIIRKYDVNFVVGGDIFARRIATKGDTITVPNPVSTERNIFLGWSLDGVNIVDTNTIQIWQHTTYFAVVETRYFVEFRANNIVQTQWVAKGKFAVPPHIDIVGYTFNYWTFNGAETNPAAFEIYNDKTYVANMTARALEIASNITVAPNTPQIEIANLIRAAYPDIDLNNIANISFTGSLSNSLSFDKANEVKNTTPIYDRVNIGGGIWMNIQVGYSYYDVYFPATISNNNVYVNFRTNAGTMAGNPTNNSYDWCIHEIKFSQIQIEFKDWAI